MTTADEGGDEQALIEALLANDEKAWRDFGGRYRGVVMRSIAGVTKRFSTLPPEDVTEIYGEWQECLVARGKAKLRAYDRSRGSGLSSYLSMLAVRCAYDWLRRVRRHSRHDPAVLPTLTHEAADPFEMAAQREALELVSRAMEHLSERDRRFASLYFEQGLHPRQVARSMKITLSTVYSKKHKITLRLESLVRAHQSVEARRVVPSRSHRLAMRHEPAHR